MQVALHPAVWMSGWDTNRAPAVLDRAAELGYWGVVVPLREPEGLDPVVIGREFASRGLRPITSGNQNPHADVSSDDPAVSAAGLHRLRHMLALTRDMGADHLGGVLYGPLDKASAPVSDVRRKRTAELLGAFADEASTMGIRVACEVVNRYETALLNTATQAVEFVHDSGSDNLGIHLDTFHMNIEERNLGDAIRHALPYLSYFELGQNHRGHLTDGTLDLSALLRTAIDAGYRGRIGVESFSASILASDIAAGLAIWRDQYDISNTVARDAIDLIRNPH